MPDMTQSVLLFSSHFLTGVALTIAFVGIHAAITPQPELKLIREGNAAAAVAVGGATLGYVIPLALVLSFTSNAVEAAAWGAVSLVVQLIGMFVTRLLIPNLARDISDGKVAAATVQAMAGVSLGLIQAGSWAP